MTLYKDLHRQHPSQSYDSPNAQLSFLKTITGKLCSPPSRPQKIILDSNIFSTEPLPTKESFFSAKDIIRTTDTIVQESPKYDLIFKSSVKRTPMSDMMTMGYATEPRKILKKGSFNQNYIGISGEDSWKPCRRKLTQKPSLEANEFQRHYKDVSEISMKYKRDPIIDGEEKIVRPTIKITKKNQDISKQYENYKEKLMFLPSDRKTFKAINNKPKDTLTLDFKGNNGNNKENEDEMKGICSNKKNLGNECKSLLSYDYALPYRNESYSKNITKFSIAERTFMYKDVNERDHRKKALIHKYKD